MELSGGSAFLSADQPIPFRDLNFASQLGRSHSEALIDLGNAVGVG